MCDGGCGKFLWCDIPCVAVEPITDCQTYLMMGFIILILAFIGYLICKIKK